MYTYSMGQVLSDKINVDHFDLEPVTQNDPAGGMALEKKFGISYLAVCRILTYGFTPTPIKFHNIQTTNVRSMELSPL